MAIAVFPVPGCPAMRMDLPAIFPSLIMLSIRPAALLASFCPTSPCEICLGSSESSSPSPLMWECAPIRSILVTSLTSPTLGVLIDIWIWFIIDITCWNYSNCCWSSYSNSPSSSCVYPGSRIGSYVYAPHSSLVSCSGSCPGFGGGFFLGSGDALPDAQRYAFRWTHYAHYLLSFITFFTPPQLFKYTLENHILYCCILFMHHSYNFLPFTPIPFLRI